MMLVELIRLRWWTIWWSAGILVIAVVLALTVQHTMVDVNGTQLGNITVPTIVLAPIAMFLAMIFATSAGLSLNREGGTLALSWTKPVARPLIALRIMAVDVVLIVGAYAFAWLVCLGIVAAAHGSLAGNPELPVIVVLSLGVAIMWYALIQAITAAIPGSAGLVVGLLWPGALILSGMRGSINATFDAAVKVLNVFNPLAYLNTSSNASAATTVSGYWQGPDDERALIVWALSIALAAVAIALWTRREA